jgi:quinol monooxygenase YgiN
MRDVGAMPVAAMLCLVAVMLSGCISRDAAKQECKTKDGGNMFVVRIAEIEVHPEWLEAYLAAAETVGAESVAKEPGVICIFPMQMKESPTSIRIVEIYRSEEAYKEHLATPHFRKYKEGTPHMIKSLELVPMRPLDESGMKQIFIKQIQN